jgi:carbonic anhydrase
MEYCTPLKGYGAAWEISFGSFEIWATNGISATEACCACGGGKRVLLAYTNTTLWNEEFPACGGLQQAPVDLVPIFDNSVPMVAGPLPAESQLLFTYQPVGGLILENKITSLQIEAPTFGNLTLPDGVYEAKKIEFHFPSEHTVKGHVLVGELQILHQKIGITSHRDMAIVSVLLQLPQEGSPIGQDERDFMTNVGFEALPERNTSKEIMLPLDLNVFDSQFMGHYWTYSGSLTKPPCTEGVQWIVLAQPGHVSALQVQNFKRLFPNPMNSRPTQYPYGRNLTMDNAGETARLAYEKVQADKLAELERAREAFDVIRGRMNAANAPPSQEPPARTMY